jgi:hypothetical protein
MNDDLLDLLGKLYIELKIAHLLRIPFAEFAADYEEHLHAASMLYVGGGVHAVDSAHQGSSEYQHPFRSQPCQTAVFPAGATRNTGNGPL